MDPADLLTRIADLEQELAQVKRGYDARDENWERHHDACMDLIRGALESQGTVPELVQKIERMRSLAGLALVAHRAPSFDALPPTFGDALARAAEAYEAVL